jgi:hypothetical protein
MTQRRTEFQASVQKAKWFILVPLLAFLFVVIRFCHCLPQHPEQNRKQRPNCGKARNSLHVEMHAVIALAGEMELFALEKKLPEASALLPSLKWELSNGLQALDVARMEMRREKVA